MKLHFFATHAEEKPMDVFIKHWDLIEENKNVILSNPKMHDIFIGRISGLWIGSTNLTLKHLFTLWGEKYNGKWVKEGCPKSKCNSKYSLILSIAGSPLSGSNSCICFCPKCKNKYYYTAQSFGKLAIPAFKIYKSNPPLNNTMDIKKLVMRLRNMD